MFVLELIGIMKHTMEAFGILSIVLRYRPEAKSMMSSNSVLNSLPERIPVDYSGYSRVHLNTSCSKVGRHLWGCQYRLGRQKLRG